MHSLSGPVFPVSFLGSSTRGFILSVELTKKNETSYVENEAEQLKGAPWETEGNHLHLVALWRF